MTKGTDVFGRIVNKPSEDELYSSIDDRAINRANQDLAKRKAIRDYADGMRDLKRREIEGRVADDKLAEDYYEAEKKKKLSATRSLRGAALSSGTTSGVGAGGVGSWSMGR